AVRAGEEGLRLPIDDFVGERGVDLAGRGLRAQAGRPELERPKDALRDQLFPRLAAGTLEHGAGNDVIHVRVSELRARLRRQGLLAPLPDQPIPEFVEVTVLGQRLLDKVAESVIVAGDATRVRQ